MGDTREGGCQCGDIRYELRGDPIALSVCHCQACQCQSGSAFGMSLIVPRDSMKLLSGTPSRFERPADGGGVVSCFFCPRCGTRVYHEPRSLPDTVNVKPGTLDETSWLSPNLHIWVKRRQSWVSIPTDVPCIEGQP